MARKFPHIPASIRTGLALLAILMAVSIFGVSHDDAAAGAGAIENLSGCTTSHLERGDDSNFSDAISMPFSANFFGQTYDHIYVNNNGNVTFDSGLADYTPESLSGTSHKIIAPFWADVDTRGDASGVVTFGPTLFGGHAAFCVNWVNVGYYNSATDKLNSFQLLLVERADSGTGDFDILMNYDRVQWETGDADGGTDGLGGSSARMGYSNGVDVSFEYPGSGVNGAFLDSAPTGLAHNNRNSLVSGRYIFEVRNGAPPVGGSVSGTIYRADTQDVLPGAIVAVCTNVCSTTVANGAGFYSLTGLPEGDYTLYVYPPTVNEILRPHQSQPFHVAADDEITGKDVTLEVADLPAAGTTFIPNRNPNQAVPWIAWHAATTLQEESPSGLGTIFVEVLQNGSVIATFSLTEGPPGSTPGTSIYSGVMPDLAPHHGWVRVRKHVGNTIEEFDAWIDPSGAVKTVGGSPIEGATVTLYRSDSPAGPFTIVPDGNAIMSPTNRTNPDLTDINGAFGWDVTAGYYKVRAEKAGCTDPNNPQVTFVETTVLTIPPAVTDLDLRLNCPEPPFVWGNVNCADGITPLDALLVMAHAAGVSIGVSSQAIACPDVGDGVSIGGNIRTWGDVDCQGGVAAPDATKILQFIVGLAVPLSVQGCPALGAGVTLGPI